MAKRSIRRKMKRRNRATRRRKMRGGGNEEQREGAATPLNEMEQLKQTHENDLTGQRGQIETKVKKYDAMKKDELGPRKANEFENLIHLYKDLNSKVDSILKNLDSVDKNRFDVLESIKKISTSTKLNEYLEGEKKTQDKDFSTLFATIDSEETKINKLKEELDSKVRAEQKARENRLNNQDEDAVSNEEGNLQSRKPPPPPEQMASDNEKIPASSNPFSNGNMTYTGKGDFFEAYNEQTERQEMGKENNLSTGLKEEKKQLEGIKKELASSEQATQGSVSSEQQSDPDSLADPVAADIFEIPSSDGLPFRIPESTASADTQTPQPSGVTVENVEMVCKKLKNKITALEEQIAKLQESNTVTPTEKKKPNTGTSTKLPKGNKGTSKGGRKSRNNKKKKKSKAKKNKTRRRRRSKA